MQCIVCNANVKLGQIKFRYLYFGMSLLYNVMIQIFVVCCYHINQSFYSIYSIHTRMNWVLRVTRDRRKTNYNWVKIIINWITLIAAKTVQFPGASVAAVCQVYCNSTEGGDWRLRTLGGAFLGLYNGHMVSPWEGKLWSFNNYGSH